MRLEHRFVIPAPPDVVWAAFDDLEGLVPCVPGATLTSADGDEFSGTVKVRLGPISMTYGGTGRFVERDRAAGRVIVQAKGKDRRGNGTAGATVTAQVTEDGSGTAVTVSTDLTVTGKPAQFGRGVIQDVSDKLLGQFVDCVSARLAPAPVAATTPAAGPGTPGPVDRSGAPGGDDTAGDGGAGAPPAADRPDGEAPPAGEAPAGDAPAGDTLDAGAAVATAATGAASSWNAAGGDSAGGGATPAADRAAPVQRPVTGPAPGHGPTPSAPAAELDLLSTVMPVLVRRFAAPVLGAVAVVAAIILVRARRRRHRRR